MTDLPRLCDFRSLGPSLRLASEQIYLYMCRSGKLEEPGYEPALISLAEVWPSPPVTVDSWSGVTGDLLGHPLSLSALTFTDERVAYLFLQNRRQGVLAGPDPCLVFLHAMRFYMGEFMGAAAGKTTGGSGGGTLKDESSARGPHRRLSLV